MKRWKFLWRRYLGWLPLQFCMICGKIHWAGLPWWSFGDRHWQWLPAWSDYCSKACCDADLEWCESWSTSHREKPAVDEKKTRSLTLELDELDEYAINRAVAVFQRLDNAAFGATILPDGESETSGAIVADICRTWLEQKGEWPGKDVE